MKDFLDIAAVAENEHRLKGLLNNMNQIFKEIHLKINLNRTKTLITHKTTPISKNIKINNTTLEQVLST